MIAYVARRIGLAALVLLTVTTLSFVLLKASGDLAITLAGEGSGADYVDFLRKTYGLDRPILEQYGRWFWSVAHGDLGTSFYYGGPVSQLVLNRLPTTLALGGLAILFALTAAIPLGILAALRPGRLVDRLVLGAALAGQAVPIFWFSFLLILLFSINLRLLPASGADTPAGFILPALALGFYAMPAVIRIVRDGMIDALGSDYIRMAMAKGLRRRTIILRHALRNTLVPVVAVASVQFGFLLGGSVVVETVFALQGIGYLTWEAIAQNDYPVVQATVLTVSAFYVVLTLAADLLNMLIDPRLRLS